MLPIVFFMEGHDQHAWMDAFREACPEAEVRAYPDWGDVNEPCYAYLWKPLPGIVAKHPGIKVIFYGGAGVDHLLADPTLPPDIPVVRLSDDGLKDGMADWVVMNVMLHQRKMPMVMANQRRGIWQKHMPTLPSKLKVGLMGYGALGKACADKVRPFGFKFNSWSNTPKAAEDDVSHYCGGDEFTDFLGNTDILVSLLPATADTNNLLDAKAFAAMPKGAAVINAGRGNVLDTTALIDAIESGHIAGASLDVFKTEPLPADDAVWDCEKIILTPHISAETRTETAAEYVIKAIKAYEADGTLVNLYERGRGY